MSRNATHQLAETAVGVREVSKQLGRARVQLDSSVRSVLIITKARDNHLIRLTRELALWLMLNKRPGKERGLVVYVDAQLRGSKRFDAHGIRAEHPHLFEPSEPAHPKKCMQMEDRRASLKHVPDAADNIDMVREQRGEDEPDGATKVTGEPPEQMVGPEDNDEEGQLRYWTSEMCSRFPQLFDLVVTLGGDGTVLFASWLFQRIVPPILPFSLGSLGFLTNFDFNRYESVLKSALERGIRVNLRMRFTATVYRAELPTTPSQSRCRRRAIRNGKTGEIMLREIKEAGWDAIEGQDASASDDTAPGPDEDEIAAKVKRRHRLQCIDTETGENTRRRGSRKDKEVMCFTTRPAETFEILNDLVVDRGPSPYVSLLEVFGDEHHMTTVQADGLCISTPTGSTAYSLSAGGSLAHPEIPAILLTPICPHTLSFRPMLLPDSMELRIAVPYSSRSAAWASFDGRGRVELRQGDHIKVTASRYPFPTVCAEDQSIDWFRSVSRTLKWNERQKQKSFVVFEDNDGDDGGGGSASASAAGGGAAGASGSGAKARKHRDEEGRGSAESASSSADKPMRRSKSSSSSGLPQEAHAGHPGRKASRQLKDRSLPNGCGPLNCDEECETKGATGVPNGREDKPVAGVHNGQVEDGTQRHAGRRKQGEAGPDDGRGNADDDDQHEEEDDDDEEEEEEDDDDDDEDDDDEDDDDDDDDEEEREEEYDITDSSAVVTRTNSPLPRQRQSSSSYSSLTGDSAATADPSSARRQRHPSNPASLSDLASDLRRRTGGLTAAVGVGQHGGPAGSASSRSSAGTSSPNGFPGAMSPPGGSSLSAIGGPSLSALRKLSPILRDTAAAGVRAAAANRPVGNVGPTGLQMQHHPGMARRLTGAGEQSRLDGSDGGGGGGAAPAAAGSAASAVGAASLGSGNASGEGGSASGDGNQRRVSNAGTALSDANPAAHRPPAGPEGSASGGAPSVDGAAAASGRTKRGNRQGAALVVYGDDSSDSDSAGE